MLQMRDYVRADRAQIEAWPVYPPEFSELDYALRANGWITEFEDKPATSIYVFEQAADIMAYTILAGTTAGDAEFRIALRADCIGRGLGAAITAMTIARAFDVEHLHRLHLIVRTNNERAKRLYAKHGFRYCGECSRLVNGKQVAYLEMELLRHA